MPQHERLPSFASSQSLSADSTGKRTPWTEELKADQPEFELKAVGNLITGRDKALHSENPTLPMKSQSGLFIATFEPSQELSEVIKVKYILHQKVTLEKVLTVEEVHCFNFQNFGHIAQNYTIVHRCVKCTKSHPREECAKQLVEEPLCCNCGQDGHPASYRGCPAYKEMVARKEAAKQRRANESSRISTL